MAEAAAPTVRTCALWVHEITMFEGDELVLSSAVFKGLAGGETIEVYHEEKREQGVVLVLRRPPQPLKRNMDVRSFVSVLSPLVAIRCISPLSGPSFLSLSCALH